MVMHPFHAALRVEGPDTKKDNRSQWRACAVGTLQRSRNAVDRAHRPEANGGAPATAEFTDEAERQAGDGKPAVRIKARRRLIEREVLGGFLHDFGARQDGVPAIEDRLALQRDAL